VIDINEQISFLADSAAIVCDNGSYSLKVGFAGEHIPQILIPTIHGERREEVSEQILLYST